MNDFSLFTKANGSIIKICEEAVAAKKPKLAPSSKPTTPNKETVTKAGETEDTSDDHADGCKSISDPKPGLQKGKRAEDLSVDKKVGDADADVDEAE